MPAFQIGHRVVGPDSPPLVIAEIGINHEGSFDKAVAMVEAAAAAGAECVKFQSHVIADEMIPNDVVPGNASESIWSIMARCALTAEQDRELVRRVEALGMIYLSTPFSRAAAVHLEALGVRAYKIGSGECNNYPLVRHVAAYGKPVILSTGMNDLASIRPAVELLRQARVPFALLHCTSVYPTPYSLVRLGALAELRDAFPDAVIGLSDHSPSIYPCLGAVALGASIVERHFTVDKTWAGPDIAVSMDPGELRQMLEGSRALFAARGGHKRILAEEQPTIAFAYACVVTTAPIRAGEPLGAHNTWVKRPGTGAILAADYERVLGRSARRDLPADVQLAWEDLA